MVPLAWVNFLIKINASRHNDFGQGARAMVQAGKVS
jgi:hypothetical protein